MAFEVNMDFCELTLTINRFISRNYDYIVWTKTDLPSQEAKLAEESRTEKKNTSA